MASACRRYSFALCKGQGLKDTALYVGKGKLCGEMVAFWQDDDRCRFGQGQIELSKKGKKNNQEVGSYNKIWEKVSTGGLRLLDKRLYVCLCSILHGTVHYGRLVLRL